MIHTVIPDSGFLRNDAIISRTSCNLKVADISRSVIDKFKQSQEQAQTLLKRRRRVALWNKIFRPLMDLCKMVTRSQAIHLHTMSFSDRDLIISPEVQLQLEGIRIRSKRFMTMAGGMTEYYQIEDCENNIIRRPVWTISADLSLLILRARNKVEYDSQTEESINGNLLAGPIQTDLITDFTLGLWENGEIGRYQQEQRKLSKEELLAEQQREAYLRCYNPMYKLLDESKYVVKDSRVENGAIITDYKENSLLFVNPRVVYTKKVWTEGEKNFISIEEDGALLEIVVSWCTPEGLYFENWSIVSLNIVSTIYTTIRDNIAYLLGISVSNKVEGYVAEIGVDNSAKVEVVSERFKPMGEGIIGYKAAVTADNRPCLIELFIPKRARIATSIHAAGKFRADIVVPMKILTVDIRKTTDTNMVMYLSSSGSTEAFSCVYKKAEGLKYVLGSELVDGQFDGKLDEVCVAGIHYCLTKKEALEFHLKGFQILSSVVENDNRANTYSDDDG